MKPTRLILLLFLPIVACNDDVVTIDVETEDVQTAGMAMPLTSPYAPLVDPWLLPFDVGQKLPSDPYLYQPSQNQMNEFAWDSFLALNWPYLATQANGEQGFRGQPDPDAPAVPIFGNANVNGTSPTVVWETYMVPGDVFTNPVGWNVEWGSPDFASLTTGIRELRPPSYNGQFAPGINQPYTHANVPTGPVVDQNKNYLRYEVTMNQSYFNYIKTFDYYNANTQKTVVGNYVNYAWDNGTAPPKGDPQYFQPVPTGTEGYVMTQPDYAQQGMVEIKAAWKVLVTDGDNPDVVDRYFRRMMKIPQPGANPDGSANTTYVTRLMGLVGFHIHRVTQHGHLPSTFEHVDNVELFKVGGDPLPLPRTPSLNPGGNASYPNGYEVGGLTGQPGLIPMAFMINENLPPSDQIPTINVSRATPIPDSVKAVNARYQDIMKDTVWRYYQLVGTQNESGVSNNNVYWKEDNPGKAPNPNLGPGIPNTNLGPGIPGPQYSNTTNLVNTTLESYTQPEFSCARCHINAFPQGVGPFPPYENRFKALHVMSFLLLNAQEPVE